MAPAFVVWCRPSHRICGVLPESLFCSLYPKQMHDVVVTMVGFRSRIIQL